MPENAIMGQEHILHFHCRKSLRTCRSTLLGSTVSFDQRVYGTAAVTAQLDSRLGLSKLLITLITEILDSMYF